MPNTFTYSYNALDRLTSGSYTYDNNGNALTDRNGLTYTYNHLNLPATATKSGTSVSYTYDALGIKQRSVGAQSPSQTKDYIAGIEYTAGVLDRIQTGEGYITLSGSTPTYHYYLTDHLGNIRSVLTPSGTTFTAIQQQDYYPFGLNKPLAGATQNRYLYNGKEIQGELGGQYDYGARFYDPMIARWNVVDPMAENHYGVSAYAYVLNNPLSYKDPFGLDTVYADNAIAGGISQQDWGRFDAIADEIHIPQVAVASAEQSSSRTNTNHRSMGMSGYFSGPSSGEYGPWTPDAVGVSVHGNIAGFSINLSAVRNQNNEHALYFGFSGGPGYTYFGSDPLRGVIGLGVTMDFYESVNSVAPVLEDITGGTYDMNMGYGVMIGRGLPIAAETNRLSTSGVQRTSLGFGTGFRLNRSFTWRVY